jgi:hypothetical protein
MQRIRRQGCGVRLARDQAAELFGDLRRADAGCFEERLSFDELDGCASGCRGCAAAACVEACLRDVSGVGGPPRVKTGAF